MEIKLFGSHEINHEKWDRLISDSGEGNVYALSGFLSRCERKWMAVVLMNEGRYIAGIPLQCTSSVGFQYIYQDPFAHELGLFFCEQVSFQLKERMLQKAFEDQILVSSYLFSVDNSHFLEEQNVVKKENFFKKPTFLLDMKRGYQEIFHCYSTNRKRDLKNARKHKQSICVGTNPDLLMSIFRKYTAPKIEGVKEYQFKLINHLLNYLLQKSIGELYHVEYEREVVSAVFITRFKNKIVYLFGAHSEKALELRSSTFVLDHIIRKYSGQDYIFDFEGSDEPGLAKFYSSFGAERKYFYEYRKNELPVIVRAAKNFRAMLIKLLKK